MKTKILSAKEQKKEHSTFSAPLNATEKARLEITNGVSNLNLTGDPSTLDLFQAQFSSLIPKVSVQNGTVTIRCRLSLAEWVKHALLWKGLPGYRSIRPSPGISICAVVWGTCRPT